MAVALYPGSFDPVHNGHLAIIEVACGLFERVIVGVGHNPEKPTGLFSPDERMEMIRQSTDHLINIEVTAFTGLTTDAARELEADCLLKGVRSGSDLDAELLQANMNARTADDLPTAFLPGIGAHALISSRYVREIALRGGDITQVVPEPVAHRLAALAEGRTV
jgi:pantetheine-phosphate adenylyltransferase